MSSRYLFETQVPNVSIIWSLLAAHSFGPDFLLTLTVAMWISDKHIDQHFRFKIYWLQNLIWLRMVSKIIFNKYQLFLFHLVFYGLNSVLNQVIPGVFIKYVSWIFLLMTGFGLVLHVLFYDYYVQDLMIFCLHIPLWTPGPLIWCDICCAVW